MTTRQLREMERQATVTTTRVQQYIDMQTQINNLIDTTSGPTPQLIKLVDELETLGDTLTNDEINQVIEWFDSRREVEMEYEDIEWMIE